MQTRVLALAALSLSLGLSAQSFTEIGDAGDLNFTAQCTVGSGPLTTIVGDATTAGDVDLFLITITDLTTFSATTCGETWDTRIYLFRTNGTALQFNDDGCGGPSQSTMDNSHVPSNGTYVLGIGRSGTDARNVAAQDIWSQTPLSGTNAPNGPGMANPVLAQWNYGASAGGIYTITLTGCGFASAGASSAALGAGCVGLTLTSNNAGPVSGGVWDITFGGAIFASDLCTVVLKAGPTLPGIPLFTQPLCNNYIGVGTFVSLPIMTGTPGPYNYVINISGAGAFLGVPVGAQGILFDTISPSFYSANALNGVIGCN